MRRYLTNNFNVFITLIAIQTIVFNQSFSQKDTLFWFAAPDYSNGLGESPVFLNVTSYDNPATVQISIPANIGFTPINVVLTANSFQSIDLTSFISQIESPSSNTINNNGLKITSTSLVSVTYEVNSTNNKEIVSLKGNAGIGDNFYVPFQKHWENASGTPKSSIEIVATENNTTVLITPKTAIVGHAANSTFSILLNEGQTYSATDVDTMATTSLSGSIVSSDKPVSVTMFEDGLTEGTCSDAVSEQITNTNYLGLSHIVRKGLGPMTESILWLFKMEPILQSIQQQQRLQQLVGEKPMIFH